MLLDEASFFFKLWHVSRFYREFSKQKAETYRKEEPHTNARLEVAMEN